MITKTSNFFNNKSKSALLSYFSQQTASCSTACQGEWSSDANQYLHKSINHTMKFQKSLLRLPVPKLEDTISRYLKSQEVILSEADFQRTTQLANQFLKGEGAKLHDELVSTNNENKHTSYISAYWFDMYLRDRASVVLNYNPFMMFHPPNTDQVTRAANIVVSTARFMRTLRESVLEPEVFHLNPKKTETSFFKRLVKMSPAFMASYTAYAMKAYPLDMSQFGNLFNSTRVPRQGKDVLLKDDTANHMLVLRNGNFYVFPILDASNQIVPPSQILACLRHISASPAPRPSHPLGFLTTENRDVWAEARLALEGAEGNEEALRQLDTAAFCLVLEDSTVCTHSDTAYRSGVNSGDQSAETAYRTFLYGDGGNRWFDKSFSVIVTKDAEASINFEHAWGDGVAVMRYVNELSQDTAKTSFVTPETSTTEEDPASLVKMLNFTVPDTVRTAVDKARASFADATSALCVNVMESDAVSKAFAKQHKLSADSVLQLGLQLAYRLQYGDTVATYESCSTSAFKHGRTETLRPATLQTRAFTDAVCRDGETSAEKLRHLISECSANHNKLTKEAVMGQGWDRHLYALRKLAVAGGVEAALFADPAYATINHNILSTSTLSSPNIALGGFAPVVRDGFGIGYVMKEDQVGFTASTYAPHRDGNAFVNNAHKAFTIIRDAFAKSS